MPIHISVHHLTIHRKVCTTMTRGRVREKFNYLFFLQTLRSEARQGRLESSHVVHKASQVSAKIKNKKQSYQQLNLIINYEVTNREKKRKKVQVW